MKPDKRGHTLRSFLYEEDETVPRGTFVTTGPLGQDYRPTPDLALTKTWLHPDDYKEMMKRTEREALARKRR